MASATLSGWPDGATVSAYVAPTAISRTPDTDALGSAVTSGVANTAGQVTLTGLTTNQAYIASDGTTRRRFIANSGPTSSLRNVDRDYGQAGMLAAPGLGWALGTRSVAANQLTFVRFVPSRDMTIGTLRIIVTTAAGADDASDAAILDAATMARLASAGAVTGKLNATGFKDYAITPLTVRAGTVYYAAHSTGALGGTAAAVMALSAGNVAAGAGAFGTTNPTAEAGQKSSAHPIANPVASAGFGGLSAFTAVWLLEA